MSQDRDQGSSEFRKRCLASYDSTDSSSESSSDSYDQENQVIHSRLVKAMKAHQTLGPAPVYCSSRAPMMELKTVDNNFPGSHPPRLSQTQVQNKVSKSKPNVSLPDG